MKKDPIIGNQSEWAKHTRNTKLGKRGTNKLIRRKVKQKIKQKDI